MTGYIKRINSVGDLVDKEIIETEQLKRNQSPSRAKNFKTAVMVTGVNDSNKEDKFLAGTFVLTEGKSLVTGDKGKVLLHKKLAKSRNKCVIVVTHSKEVADEADCVLEIKDKQLIIKQ